MRARSLKLDLLRNNIFVKIENKKVPAREDLLFGSGWWGRDRAKVSAIGSGFW